MEQTLSQSPPEPRPGARDPNAGVPEPQAGVPELPPVCIDEAWRRARADYEAGASGPVAAERHGLNARTLRRRAAAEGWRRPPGAVFGMLMALQPDAPGRLRCAPHRDADEQTEDDPRLSPFVAANSLEIGAMLMLPRPDALARFAFRRAVEAAGAGAPHETTQWLRVVEQLRRTEALLDPLTAPVSAADCARAVLAEQMTDLAGFWAEEEEPAPPEEAPPADRDRE